MRWNPRADCRPDAMRHELPESPFLLRFGRRGDVLRVEVAGESSFENTIAYWQAIVSEVRRERPRGMMLIDELHGTPLAGAQWRQLVESMRGRGLEGIRIAHVKPQGLQALEYCELHAREVGFDARAFDRERAAEFWLLYGDRDDADRPAANDGAAPRPAGDQFGLVFRREADFLLADVSGWIGDVESIIGLFLRCATELREARSRKLLVLDHTRGVVPPEAEMRRLLAALEGSDIKAARIAYVDVRGTAVGRIEVAEILGRERGYDVSVFDNEQRARIWLNYGAG